MGEITSDSIQIGLKATPRILADSYINTGKALLPYITDSSFSFTGSQSFKIDFKYIGSAPSSNYAHIMSIQDSQGKNVNLNITLTAYNASTNLAGLEISMGSGRKIISVSLYDRHVVEVNYNGNNYEIIVDGVLTQEIISPVYTGGGLTFFAKHGVSPTDSREGYSNLYGLEVTENNVITYKYVPNENGTLLETVSERVLSNQGTGKITYFPPVYEDTIEAEIVRINQAKSSIKSSIEAKGVTVGNGTIDTYASKIAQIPTGGDSDYNAYMIMSTNEFEYLSAEDGDYAMLPSDYSMPLEAKVFGDNKYAVIYDMDFSPNLMADLTQYNSQISLTDLFAEVGQSWSSQIMQIQYSPGWSGDYTLTFTINSSTTISYTSQDGINWTTSDAVPVQFQNGVIASGNDWSGANAQFLADLFSNSTSIYVMQHSSLVWEARDYSGSIVWELIM